MVNEHTFHICIIYCIIKYSKLKHLRKSLYYIFQYISWKKSASKWTHTVQIYIVQDSPILPTWLHQLIPTKKTGVLFYATSLTFGIIWSFYFWPTGKVQSRGLILALPLLPRNLTTVSHLLIYQDSIPMNHLLTFTIFSIYHNNHLYTPDTHLLHMRQK